MAGWLYMNQEDYMNPKSSYYLQWCCQGPAGGQRPGLGGHRGLGRRGVRGRGDLQGHPQAQLLVLTSAVLTSVNN